MQKKSKNTNPNQNKEISKIMYQYIPYWPLFVLSFALFGALAWTYIKFTIPVYEVSANILIKDEKKGSDNPRAVESLNAYASKKIVENEIEVIRSRELLNKIVKSLYLYAPVFYKDFLQSRSAYVTSPIIIEAQQPETLEEHEKIRFVFDQKRNVIKINANQYPLDQWVNTPYGSLRFLKNSTHLKNVPGELYFSLINPHKVTSKLQKKLEVSQSNKLSTVIAFKLKDEVPERGKAILNGLVNTYNNDIHNEKNVLATQTLKFIENRIQRVVKELDSIETRIQKYKSQQGVTDLGEQGRLVLQNISENDRRLSGINMQLAVLGQVEGALRNNNDISPIPPSTLGMDDPVLTQLLQKLYDSEMQYERLKKTTPSGNPMMYSLRNEIDNIKPIILSNINTQKISLLASRKDLSATSGMYASKISTIPAKERELLEISRQHAIKNEAYSYLLQKREETALSTASTVPDTRIVDRAEASINPVSPKKLLIYLGAFVIAFIGSILYVNTREVLSDKILFRSEIEAMTKIPVVSEVIKVTSKNQLVVNDNNQVFVAEQFRQLRAAIGLFGINLKHRKLLVTSSISGEGKSFISTNLALSLALSGKKILLLDMDLRNPKASATFGFQDKAGISELMMNDKELDEIIYQTDFKNLYILPAGSVQINTTELLLNSHIDHLLKDLQNKFDVLVVDSAPVDPVMDAFILSGFCDFTLLVVRHRYTPKTMIQLLDDNNKIQALKNSAIVFNSVCPRGFGKKGYGLGYGYGYMNVYGNKTYQTKHIS